MIFLKRNRKKRGATFFSVLMGILLLSLAAVPLITSLIDQTKATKMSKMRVFANQLAYNMIERFRTEKFSAVAASLDSPDAGAVFISEDELLNPRDVSQSYQSFIVQFKRSIVLTPISSRKGILDVSVIWMEDGHQREVKFATVLVDTTFDGGMP
jgi:type II secretory pathway pseudopilin PulG